MLTVIRDEREQIQAVCDWWPVDAIGQWNPSGEYIWVEQLELAPGINGKQMIPRIIKDIATRTPWARFGYWERRDKVNCQPRTYTREQLLKEQLVTQWL